MFAERIKKELKTVLSKLQIPISEEEIMLEHPAEMEHGDYSTNFAMAKFVQFPANFFPKFNGASKVQSSHRRRRDPVRRREKCKVAGTLPNSPRELAEKVVDKWQEIGFPDFVEKVEVEGPGFINIWLKFESLGSHLVSLLNKDFTREGFGGFEGVEGKKTMVIDYSAPNIAKPFGIGHLRSTNIGQALYNLYQFLGWRAIGDNHLGDWGTQFGKLIFQIVRHLKNHPEPVRLRSGQALAEGSLSRVQSDSLDSLSINDLEKLYVEFHQEAEEHPEIEEEARIWFKKLEEGDPEAKRIWQACVDISLKEFERIYQLLGVKIDYAYGESFYLDKMGDVLKDCEQKGLLKESEGAKVIEIPAEKVPAMLIKSDGATTYLLRDLATIKFRMEKWEPDLIIYEVGADQTFYFRQLFKLCVLLGYGRLNQFVHVPHGLIRRKSGKFSTRKGMTIHLKEVLGEAIKRAEKLCETAGVAKELSEKEREKVAKAVGIGAIKYNDLKQNPTTDIIFDWDQMLTLSGNSGPYLQYTYARIKSVLGKSELSLRANAKQSHLVGDCFGDKPLAMTEEEQLLLRTIYKFPEEVEKAAKTFSPNLLCNFLFDLCQKFNLFYDKERIIGSENEAFRLLLTAAVGQVLKNGLSLLGIEALEKM